MSKHKHYPIRIPRYATGIRAQESRMGGGRSWWAQRWVETLERMGLGARLGRGKNYALSGQVVEMKLEGPQVSAMVVGSRPDAYAVTVDFRIPDDAAHDRIVARLRSEPMLIARLLVDDMPMEIEARGLVVQFPEPVNQKAEAVLISNGISTDGMVSTQLEESDITESTMVFTMESSQRERIIESFADIDPEQVFVLSQYVGDELEILDPYGGTLQSYGLCYESLRATLKKLVKLLNANGENNQ